MARGAIGKEKVLKTIQEAFGDDWIGEDNKKYYVWVDDGGERVQIAISLTCPKNMIGSVPVVGDGLDFSAAPIVAPTKFEPAKITQQEKDTLAEMMARLGL